MILETLGGHRSNMFMLLVSGRTRIPVHLEDRILVPLIP